MGDSVEDLLKRFALPIARKSGGQASMQALDTLPLLSKCFPALAAYMPPSSSSSSGLQNALLKGPFSSPTVMEVDAKLIRSTESLYGSSQLGGDLENDSQSERNKKSLFGRRRADGGEREEDQMEVKISHSSRRNNNARVYPVVSSQSTYGRVFSKDTQIGRRKRSGEAPVSLGGILWNVLDTWMKGNNQSKRESASEGTGESEVLKQLKKIAWHKYQQKIAVVSGTDEVGIYDVLEECWRAVLDHEFQRGCRCIEWQPRSASGLAVGCDHGVCLWSFKLEWMAFLKHDSPVERLAWSPCGRLLATATSKSVQVWDVASRSATTIRTMSSASSAGELLWSPNGYFLLFSNAGRGLWVWETLSWDCEMYSDFEFAIQAVTWTADGKHALVVTGPGTQESTDSGIVLHVLAFPSEPPRLNSHVLPLTLDLAANSGVSLGLFNPSQVRCIAINDTNDRLAVCYHGAPGIALYAAKSTSKLSFFFLGNVWGPPGFLPCQIEFKPHFDRGALLAILFQSLTDDAASQIRFVPMYL